MRTFTKNIFRYRRELEKVHSWSENSTFFMMRRSLTLTKEELRKNGNEIEETRFEKIKLIERAIVLLTHIIEDQFLELAETQIGIKVVSNLDFIEIEGSENYKIVNKSPEHDKNNSEIFTLSKKIEEEEWNELFEILKGSEKFRGSDIRSWWN